jgi:hypothetical protein
MAESRDLRDLFERDLRQIAVPPESEWFAAAPTERPMPRWLLATTAVAAIVVALVFGSYLYSRLPGKPGGVLATPTPTATFRSPFAPFMSKVGGRVTDAATGQSLSSVRVSLMGTTRLGGFDVVGTALTDAAGRYEIPVMNGTYRVFIFAPRSTEVGVCPWRPEPCAPDDVIASTPYQPLWWPDGISETLGDELKVDADRDDLNVLLKQSHEIVGSFHYQGLPARAALVVFRAGTQDLVVIALTNPDGTFRIPVADGAYRVDFQVFYPGPTGGLWPVDIVVNGADVVGIDRVEQ